jgi:hypothetical protein
MVAESLMTDIQPNEIPNTESKVSETKLMTDFLPIKK